MRIFYLSLLCYLSGYFTGTSASNEAAEAVEELYFTNDCNSSSSLDSQTTCDKAVQQHFGLYKCWHSPSPGYEATVYISKMQPYSGTNYNWFIATFDGQMQIESVDYKTRTETALKPFCRMCHFDVLYKVHSLANDDPFIKCATYHSGYFVEKRIACAAIATAIKIVNKRLSVIGSYQYLEICELKAYGIRRNYGGKEELEEMQFTKCKSSDLYDHSTVCENAINNKRDQCGTHGKVFASKVQPTSPVDAFVKGNWFIGYFDALVNLDSILYVAGTHPTSVANCKMCRFDILFELPEKTPYLDFVKCNSYNPVSSAAFVSSKYAFKSKILKCKSTTRAVKIVNTMQSVAATNYWQHLEICELTAFGKIAIEESQPKIKFASCSNSDIYSEKTDCQKAINGDHDNCVTLEKMFSSALQATKLDREFSGHWFIGRFETLVQLDSVLYRPRIEAYSISRCRMCDFDLLYSVRKFSYEAFSVCGVLKTTVAFKWKVIKCQRETTAIKFVNNRVTSPDSYQYLEICEITAFGAKSSSKPKMASEPNATQEN